MGWGFNKYVHHTISVDHMCIAACVTIIPPRIHSDTMIWYRLPFQPVRKRRSCSACIRNVEAFSQMVTKIDGLVDSICGECICQFSLDKHGAPHDIPWNGSFECGALNPIHRQTQDRSYKAVIILTVKNLNRDRLNALSHQMMNMKKSCTLHSLQTYVRHYLLVDIFSRLPWLGVMNLSRT